MEAPCGLKDWWNKLHMYAYQIWKENENITSR